MTTRQVAQLALERSTSYVKLYFHELEVLQTLPLWMTALFVQLVRRAGNASGLGATTYPELVKLLRPLQPRTGRRHYAPDEWAIWRALVLFDRAHIVWRNTGYSQVRGAIVYEIAPRKAPPRPKSESAPGVRTPPNSLQNEQRRGL